MQPQYRILIQATGIGLRYIGKNHTKARQEYVKDRGRALVLVDQAQAREFAKGCAERSGCPHQIDEDGRGVIETIRGAKR